MHDAKSPATCLVICNNMSEAELEKARDPDILRVYRDAVGSEISSRYVNNRPNV